MPIPSANAELSAGAARVLPARSSQDGFPEADHSEVGRSLREVRGEAARREVQVRGRSRSLVNSAGHRARVLGAHMTKCFCPPEH